MTSRSFVEVSVDTLEAMAWSQPGLSIEVDSSRAYLRVGNTTFSAELPAEVTA